LRALLKSQTKESAALELEKICADSHEVFFRTSCVMQMGQLHEKSLIPTLKQYLTLKDEDGAVQTTAALSLALLGDASGMARAQQSVQLGEPWADTGMMTLEALNAKSAIPQLEDTLDSSQNYWAKNDCRVAILRIKLKDADAKSSLALLGQVLHENKHLSHAEGWAVRKLVELGTPEAGKTLAEAAKARGEASGVALKGLRGGVEMGRWDKDEILKWLTK
jgi:HEAT repeat protein